MQVKLKAGHYTAEGKTLEAGQVVEWKGDLTPDMEPIDDDSNAAYEAAFEWDKLNRRFVPRKK